MTIMTLLMIVGFLLLAMGSVAVFYRMMAIEHKADAERQKSRAEQAEIIVAHSKKLDKSREELSQKHRQETIDETKPAHLAARTDFDNDWSGVPVDNAGDTPDRRANPPGATGAAQDTGHRTRMSDG